MAKVVSNIDTLQYYLEGVMSRSGHHADEVHEVVLTLIGAVVWKKDDKPIQVKEYAGEPANILWWHSKKGNKYAFRYDHPTHCIELRKDSFRGDVIATFDNKTQASEIIQLFKTL